MKVLVVSGPGLYAFSLCEGLVGAGARPTLLTIEGAAGLVPFAREFVMRPVLSEKQSYAAQVRTVVAAASEIAPDVVHLQWTFAPRKDWLLYALLRRWLPPVVLTVHNPLPHEPARGEAWALARLYRSVPRLIVHAESMKQELADRFGVPAARITVVAHGNFGFYREAFALPTRLQAREWLGVPEQAPVILFFGGWKDYKGLEDVLEAFPSVRKRSPNAILVMAGDPGRTDPAPLVRQAAALGVEGVVRLHARYVPLDEVRWYFAAADVVVLPYRSGTYSGVVHVAYAFGKPVVTTDVGAIGEMVRQDGTGLVVPPRDPDALARALCRLLADPAAAVAMGARGRQLGETRYNWQAIGRAHLALYHDVLSLAGA